MKAVKLLAGPINTIKRVMNLPRMGRSKEQKGLKEEQLGSIVLEAAIVTPFLLIVLMVFIMLISLCAAQMALHSAASNTARQLAAHMRPVALAAAHLPTLPGGPAGLSGWEEIAASGAEWLPEPAGELVASALRGDWQPLVNLAASELGRHAVEPYIRKAMKDDAVLDSDRIALAKLTLPDLQRRDPAYLSIVLEYQYPLKLPFFGKPLVLRERASERVWLSDAKAAQYGSENGVEGEVLTLQVVAVHPSPLRPGRKATVTARTNPGARVSLGVLYKSGSSKAKHLGEAVADENGFVQWTWHVSGNTTPGIWQLTISTSDGERQVSRHFIVEKQEQELE
ncbi:TadE family protein [Paenibacillus chungangensis]|uniref:TadE family protein n=1 Tax=Paenibacillus chungangensis TaxID=696535 RepID=A0ABW3HUF3_9BACL